MSWRDALERRALVKAAFVEGLELGGDISETAIEKAWLGSKARASLAEPAGDVPPVPRTIGPIDNSGGQGIASHLGKALSQEPQCEEPRDAQ